MAATWAATRAATDGPDLPEGRSDGEGGVRPSARAGGLSWPGGPGARRPEEASGGDTARRRRSRRQRATATQLGGGAEAWQLSSSSARRRGRERGRRGGASPTAIDDDLREELQGVTHAMREEVARELAHRVSDGSAGGMPVSVAREAFAAVAGVLWWSMFSEDMDAATTRQLRDVIEEAVVVAGAPNLSDYFPVIAAADVMGVRRRMDNLVGWVYGIIDVQIDRRRRRRIVCEPRKNDLLDVAFDMEGEVESEGWVMNQDTMRGMFMDLLVAGSGSTSSTIEWAMAELLQNPKSMIQLPEELKGLMGTKTHVAESDISQLPYLQAVIKETLRLHPTVPIAFNKAEATVEIQGYKIPQGTTVYVNIWAICRRAKIWDDLDKFMPYRFLGRDINFLGTNFEFIPFGAGRRICLGMPLAEGMLHACI
uniref:Cytochrome P450 family protein, expressed n=6 Tax=Oryza sativa subsp. japonica TaxID=39947 RepID=Q8LNK1_ORYSJ|nr:Putative cytochrome P450 [Oryza sativa Japonica Group]AAP52349.1 Cytochrome P450 family protein, expressed [Oryza sativa Japonica Group]